MHNWGDESVDWGGINDAARFIAVNLRRWGRIAVTDYKEKYGTVRVYCHFGFDCFHSIWRPSYLWIHPKWPYKLDLRLSKYVMPILNKIIVPWQIFIYRNFYRRAINKWPHLYKEIVSCAAHGQLFEGHIEGYKHSDYWTTL